MTSPINPWQTLDELYAEALDVVYRRPDLTRSEVLARLDDLEERAQHIARQIERYADFGV